MQHIPQSGENMKLIVDEELHQEHTRALATQLVADAIDVLEQHGLLTKEQNRDVAKDLLFRVCAVLDGSAYPGAIDDEEIAPFIGFYREDDDVLIPEGGSAMHEFIADLVDGHQSEEG
jgi:hypothetical protein